MLIILVTMTLMWNYLLVPIWSRSDPSQPTMRLLCHCVLLCCRSLASLHQMGFLHHMEEVDGAALLSTWLLRNSWNVHASLICAVALRVCADKMWQKKKKNLKNGETKKKIVDDKSIYCVVMAAGRNSDVLAEAFRKHRSPSGESFLLMKASISLNWLFWARRAFKHSCGHFKQNNSRHWTQLRKGKITDC